VTAQRVYRWNVGDGKLVGGFALNGSANRAAFSPDGKRLATAGEGGRVTLWDVPTGQQLLDLSGFSVMMTVLAFSPDGTRLACGGIEGGRAVVKIWDARPLAPRDVNGAR
jgi:WD40 repeat protein